MLNKYGLIWIFTIIFVVLYCILLDIRGIDQTNPMRYISIVKIHPVSNSDSTKCPDVGSMMTQGTWKTRPLTEAEDAEVDLYYTNVRGGNLPKALERSDKKCGNVSFTKWQRALCNPKGETPCCYNGMCVKKTVNECRCKYCFDFRSQIHAEYSTFIPQDKRCQVKYFNGRTACDVFKGRIVFVGDSLMRHFFTGFQILMADGDYNKVFLPKLDQASRVNCTGLYIFGEKYCRWTMRKGASMCNHTLSVSLLYNYKLAMRKAFHSFVKRNLHDRTVFVVSAGTHDSFNETIFKEYMLPAIELLQNRTWPRIIWATNHRFGILKTSAANQGNSNMEKYNAFMTKNLRKYAIPILEMYNLTRDVMSPDGTHYGKGINVMKAQLLLNLLEDLNW